MVVCLEQGADLPMAQVMPLPLTVSCFSKIQIGFTFLVAAHPGSPRKRAVKRVCVCVCKALSDVTDADRFTSCCVLQDSGAFVFGLLSFCDKLAGGAAILIIQLYCPCAYVSSLVLLVMLPAAVMKFADI